jgi:hypothetical protein
MADLELRGYIRFYYTLPRTELPRRYAFHQIGRNMLGQTPEIMIGLRVWHA